MRRYKQQSFKSGDGIDFDAQTEAQEFAESLMLIYRSAKIPKRVHPQSTSRLSKDWAYQIQKAKESREPDELLQDMQRFTEDPYWVERGCPLNAFFSRKASPAPEPEPEPLREVVKTDNFQLRKIVLSSSIIRACNSQDTSADEKTLYLSFLKEINSKDLTVDRLSVIESRF